MGGFFLMALFDGLVLLLTQTHAEDSLQPIPCWQAVYPAATVCVGWRATIDKKAPFLPDTPIK